MTFDVSGGLNYVFLAAIKAWTVEDPLCFALLDFIFWLPLLTLAVVSPYYTGKRLPDVVAVAILHCTLWLIN